MSILYCTGMTGEKTANAKQYLPSLPANNKSVRENYSSQELLKFNMLGKRLQDIFDLRAFRNTTDVLFYKLHK